MVTVDINYNLSLESNFFISNWIRPTVSARVHCAVCVFLGTELWNLDNKEHLSHWMTERADANVKIIIAVTELRTKCAIAWRAKCITVLWPHWRYQKRNILNKEGKTSSFNCKCIRLYRFYWSLKCVIVHFVPFSNANSQKKNWFEQSPNILMKCKNSGKNLNGLVYY